MIQAIIKAASRGLLAAMLGTLATLGATHACAASFAHTVSIERGIEIDTARGRAALAPQDGEKAPREEVIRNYGNSFLPPCKEGAVKSVSAERANALCACTLEKAQAVLREKLPEMVSEKDINRVLKKYVMPKLTPWVEACLKETEGK